MVRCRSTIYILFTAWLDSFQVLWDNTEAVFLASIGLSISAIVLTWIKCSNNDRNINSSKNEDSKLKSTNNEDIKIETLSTKDSSIKYSKIEDTLKNNSELLSERGKNEENKSLNDSNILLEEDAVPVMLAESSSYLINKQLAYEVEDCMNKGEKLQELEAKNKQLAAIFKLMQEQEEKFGNTSMDDLKEQMKFYCG